MQPFAQFGFVPLAIGFLCFADDFGVKCHGLIIARLRARANSVQLKQSHLHQFTGGDAVRIDRDDHHPVGFDEGVDEITLSKHRLGP